MANRDRLARFIRARCGRSADDGEMEDLVQELWLRARMTDSAQVADPLSYLYRTAHHLVLDCRRGASRARARHADWGYAHDRDHNAVEEAIAERRLLARERLRTVDVALGAVGERAARIFRRYRIDGIDQRQIAEELGISLSTVEKDLRKAYGALLTLKKSFDDE